MKLPYLMAYKVLFISKSNSKQKQSTLILIWEVGPPLTFYVLKTSLNMGS